MKRARAQARRGHESLCFLCYTGRTLRKSYNRGRKKKACCRCLRPWSEQEGGSTGEIGSERGCDPRSASVVMTFVQGEWQLIQIKAWTLCRARPVAGRVCGQRYVEANNDGHRCKCDSGRMRRRVDLGKLVSMLIYGQQKVELERLRNKGIRDICICGQTCRWEVGRGEPAKNWNIRRSDADFSRRPEACEQTVMAGQMGWTPPP